MQQKFKNKYLRGECWTTDWTTWVHKVQHTTPCGMDSKHNFIGTRNTQIISLNNALFQVWLFDYMALWAFLVLYVHCETWF